MAVMGMAGEMLVTPFGALIAGFLAGLISPLGFRFFTVSHLGTAKDTDPRSEDHVPLGAAARPTCISQTCKRGAAAQPPWATDPHPNTSSSLCSPQPVLRSRLKIQDTCGVHNIHGLPGILGALLGTLLTLLATADTYGDR